MSRSFHSIARRRARNLPETRDWLRLRLSRQAKEEDHGTTGLRDHGTAAEETTGPQDNGTTEGEA